MCRKVRGSVATLNYLRLGAARVVEDASLHTTAQPGLLGNLNRPPCHSLSALVRIRMKIRINWPLNPRYV